MKLVTTCESCENKVKLNYDETRCHVQYCPFCGEEMEDEGDLEIEDQPDIDSDEWG